MAQIWDVYLDADDAHALLHAAEVLERHRWIREPLPFAEVTRLLARLRKIVSVAEEDASNWQFEAEDRREEAKADGGRWGTPAWAATMAATAADLAEGSREVLVAVGAAADDLAARIEARPPLELT